MTKENMLTTKFVSYYRVSTLGQKHGIDAQRSTVAKYISQYGGKVIAEYQEKASGRCNSRPELQKALNECHRTGATLLVAKLDRLSRSVSFIFSLRDMGYSFVACDLPESSILTLAIYAAMAQQEAELISGRTKAALAVLKANGKHLGRKKGEGCEEYVRQRSLEVRRENSRSNPANVAAWNIVEACLKHGMRWSGIVKELNSKGYKTAKNGSWCIVKVQRLAKMMQ